MKWLYGGAILAGVLWALGPFIYTRVTKDWND